MLEVGIVVFNNVEELDFIGPYETISYCNKLRAKSVNVQLIASTLSVLQAFNGLRFFPHESFNCQKQYDIIIIPGGKGRKEAMHDKEILDFIKHQAPKAKFICSVCTGAFILAETGLVNDLAATTHYTAITEMRERYKSIKILNKRVVKNKKYWFAAGISSGIDLSLELIKELLGDNFKKTIAQRLEYTPQI